MKVALCDAMRVSNKRFAASAITRPRGKLKTYGTLLKRKRKDGNSGIRSAPNKFFRAKLQLPFLLLAERLNA